MMLLDVCAYLNELEFICSLQTTFFINLLTFYIFFRLETNVSCLLFYLHFTVGLFQKIAISFKFIKSMRLKRRKKCATKSRLKNLNLTKDHKTNS